MLFKCEWTIQDGIIGTARKVKGRWVDFRPALKPELRNGHAFRCEPFPTYLPTLVVWVDASRSVWVDKRTLHFPVEVAEASVIRPRISELPPWVPNQLRETVGMYDGIDGGPNFPLPDRLEQVIGKVFSYRFQNQRFQISARRYLGLTEGCWTDLLGRYYEKYPPCPPIELLGAAMATLLSNLHLRVDELLKKPNSRRLLERTVLLKQGKFRPGLFDEQLREVKRLRSEFCSIEPRNDVIFDAVCKQVTRWAEQQQARQ